MTKRTRRVLESVSPSDSASFYESLYRWAPTDLLRETSTFTTPKSISTYRKRQSCHPSRVFGKDHDKFVRMVACRVGEPVCADKASDPEGAFCFAYSTPRAPSVSFTRPFSEGRGFGCLSPLRAYLIDWIECSPRLTSS